MINVNDIKIFIDFLANKEQSGTSYSITQLNNLFQAANIDLFKLRYGLPEEYTPAMPLPRMAYEVTQKMKDDLRSCKEILNISVDSVGEMILPNNYVHVTDVSYLKYVSQCCGTPPTLSRRRVEQIDDDKWSERCSNSIKRPSKDFPICNFLKDRIRIEPRDLGTVEFSYLRVPNQPVWGYNVVGGVEVYDSSKSTNFDWNEILFTDIAKLIVGYLSINLRDQELYAAVDQYKTKGI